jgi:tetratricopeptide (TPR) repeat protein
MDEWGILGISPTKDIPIIKKAYASKLKTCRPEDNLQGFQQLREAYEAALQYTKKNEKEIPHADKNNFVNENGEDSLINTTIVIDTAPLEDFVNPEPDIQVQYEELMKQLEVLYDNYYMRIDINNWETLLNCDIMWDVNNKDMLSYSILDFLSEHHYLPQNVWKLLDANFNWSLREDFYYEYDEKFIKYIVKQVKQNRSLSYLYIKDIENFDHEEYLRSRDIVFAALEENDLDTAHLWLCAAKKIYPDDLDLLHLEGECLMREGKLEDALAMIETLLDKNPADINGLFCVAYIYFRKKQYQLAINEYTKLQAYMPGNPVLFLFLGKCYYMLKNFEIAKDYFLKILESRQNDAEVLNYLLLINIEMRKRLYFQLILHPQNDNTKQKLNNIKREIKQNIKSDTKHRFIWAQNKKILFRNMALIVFAICLLAVCFVIKDAISERRLIGQLDTIYISNNDELNQRYPNKDRVFLNVTDFNSLSLYYVWDKEISDKQEIHYNAKPNSVSGYVYIGIYDGKASIFVSRDYIQISSPASLSFTGTILEMPSEDSINKVKKYLEYYPILQEYTDKINTETFILIDEENYLITEQRMNPLVFLKTYWYFAIPLVIIIYTLNNLNTLLYYKRRLQL